MSLLAVRFRALALLITLALPLVLAGPARGDIITQYTFPTVNLGTTGPGYQPTTVAANTTATDVSISPTVASATIENFGYPTDPVLRLEPGPGVTTAALAVANNTFFAFTVSANPGFVLNLNNLTFDAGRGGETTPRGWVLRSSVDGFASDIDTQLVPTVRPDFTAFTVNLSGAQFNDLSAVTFRLYDFVPGGGQSLEFDNVTLNGTPSPVPEPHSLGLFGLGALGLVGYAWRRRAA
jgi:hypothetical protein